MSAGRTLTSPSKSTRVADQPRVVGRAPGSMAAQRDLGGELVDVVELARRVAATGDRAGVGALEQGRRDGALDHVARDDDEVDAALLERRDAARGARPRPRAWTARRARTRASSASSRMKCAWWLVTNTTREPSPSSGSAVCEHVHLRVAVELQRVVLGHARTPCRPRHSARGCRARRTRARTSANIALTDAGSVRSAPTTSASTPGSRSSAASFSARGRLVAVVDDDVRAGLRRGGARCRRRCRGTSP